MLHFLLAICLLEFACGKIDESELIENNIQVISKLPKPYDGVATFPVPFIVSVQANKGGGTYTHLCGGSIVDESFIITAAHCFHEYKRADQISIFYGANLLSTGGNRTFVKTIALHEHYYPLMGRDIALLKVDPKIVLDGKNADKIDYNNTKHIDENVDGYLLGWGSNKAGKDLDVVSFRTYANVTCRKKGFKYLSSTEVCAVNYSGRGACDGDSGGPLVNTEFNLQYAMLSYGKKPCARNRIYAFTNLNPLAEWITKNMARLLEL